MSDVDALLTAAAADPDAKAWIDLHEVACQEGFHDPQARRVLARLAESAAGFAPAHRDWPLIVAGQVAGDLPPSSRPGCAGPLAALRALAVEWLATPVEPRL